MPRPTTLPAPLNGTFAAKRPTGFILGTIITVVAVFGGLIGTSMIYSMITGTMDAPAWMTIVAFGAIVLLIFLWVRFKEGRKFSTLGFTNAHRAPRQILLGAGTGVGLVAISMVLLALTGQGSISWTAGAMTGSQWIMLVAWIAIFGVQSSAEEVAMRGFAMQSYARSFGAPVAIVLQAVLFAALHGQNDGMNVLPIINLLLVGLVLGCWAIRDGALWGVCAFHAAWNWSQSWLFGAAVSGQSSKGGSVFTTTTSESGNALLTGGTFGIEGSIIVTVVLAAMLAVLVRPAVRKVKEAREAAPVADSVTVAGA
ncbi:CPBP family intramembrane metalloprotease [Leucobacter sp. cx-42]|uniref:CPBP family intramembrane glutamic endopeptidase n=1 Tax=unclassified Leucobacter TaxID=2621730 RepID=UPI00165D4C7A|nr:CPBP family intramembrane metalloprotease [Leucobacter sp. cx-42]